MNIFFRLLPCVTLAVILAGCGGGGDSMIQPSSSPALKTYPSIWINARWSGGARGLPI